MRKTRKWLGLAVLGVMLICSTGCGGKKEEQVLKLGLATPLTGPAAYSGGVVKNAVTMAVDEINESGGINGTWKIELYVEDNENEPAKSVSATEKLINQDGVQVLISGTNSSCVLADMAVSQQAQVPELAPASTAPALTEQGNPYIFRTATTDAVNVKTLYKYLTQEMGLNRIAVLYRTDDFGMNGMALLEEYAPEYGVEILQRETFNITDRDFSVQLTKIKESNAEALFIWGQYEEVTLMCKQMKQYDVKLPILGAGYNSPKLVEMGGADVEGIMFAASFSDANPDPVVQEFDKKYKERFSGESYDQNAPQSYDTVYLIADAVKKAGSLESEKIRDILAQTNGFDGISGVLSFDENGEAIKDVLMIQIENGQHKILEFSK